MKKRKILNAVMVLISIFVVLCGIMTVGSIKGWFQKDESSLKITEKSGIVMIERSGIAYEVDAQIEIRKEDKLYTKPASTIAISENDNSVIYMNENSEIFVEELEDIPTVRVTQGELLVDTRNWDNTVSLLSEETRIEVGKSVATVSTQAGASMVYVYSGEISITGENVEEPIKVSAGQMISIVENAKGETDISINELSVSILNDFEIEQLKKCGIDKSFCFTEEVLDQVQKQREEENQKAQQEQILQGKSSEETSNQVAEETDDEASEEVSTPTSEENRNQETGGTSAATTEETGNQEDAQNEETENPSQSEQEETESDAKYCSIEIRCDTILNNMGNLTPGKEAYVPTNGVILATSQIEFSEGETVFDVLKRACDLTGIQIEYSYTPMYKSYYIEGINHLYEFDCGDESGWMYKVNGWFPNYGCSSYTLKDGDVIVWCYTCNGLGADVGGGVY